ncbi:MAG: hydrogenase maturation protease [Bacteroidales bacterium]|nr:hydrogenase maturation protease [Bacteroidales bacterium]
MLQDLEKILTQTGRKILFVGIGNVLKQDDGAGVYISNRIVERDNIGTLTVEVSIENYIGKINSLNPDILVLIDCMNTGSPPGSAVLLPVERVMDLTFNTHNISLKNIADFFTAEVYILGIQPVSIDFGENISYLVRIVSNEIINLINKRR